MTKDGLGLAKSSGQVFFVKDGIVGDKVETIVTKVDKNVIYAKVLNIIEKSQFRVDSKCNIANSCGGCQLLNLKYDKQIDIKINYVLSCLKKIGNLKNITSTDLNEYDSTIEKYFDDNIDKSDNNKVIYDGIKKSKNIYNFRNKMQVPFANKNNKIIYGFYATRTHNIIECSKCEVGFVGSNIILEAIKYSLEKSNISIYDEKTNNGLFREVMFRRGNTSKEVSITYIINDNNYKKNIDKYKSFDNIVIDYYNKYIKNKNEEHLDIVTSTININTNNNNVIFGNENYTIRGKGYIEDTIGNIKYHISPESFYQINMYMTKELYDTIIEFAEFSGDESVLDLYCGIGTISLYIAKSVKCVKGIDVVEKAIENAKENAKINSIDNVSFSCEDLTKNDLNKKIVLNYDTYDTIIVDPPRKGLDTNTIDFINEVLPKKIIYVSCDPATLSRDINILCNGKESHYKVLKIKNVDMFPNTMHIETVCLLQKCI